uniref:Uncharacterized protein n=1 Tax=Oryza punctata TaxID=4537 RepID=A0A0E0JVN2_ORYPU
MCQRGGWLIVFPSYDEKVTTQLVLMATDGGIGVGCAGSDEVVAVLKKAEWERTQKLTLPLVYRVEERLLWEEVTEWRRGQGGGERRREERKRGGGGGIHSCSYLRTDHSPTTLTPSPPCSPDWRNASSRCTTAARSTENTGPPSRIPLPHLGCVIFGA